MQIVLGETAGFCFGVQNAVDKANVISKEEREIYCLGEIVHNKEVTRKLEEQGIKFIENIEKGKNKVIIRAHGIEKSTYNKAKKLGIQVIDLTCPKVLKIHKIAQEYSNKGYFIFLTGKKEHPETIGTISYCGEHLYLIENEQDLDNAIEVLEKTKIKNVLVISQTTFNIFSFQNIVFRIEQRLSKEYLLEIKNTICSATKLRQDETKKIAKEVELMIIIGGKHSSNTIELFNTSKKICKTIFVENEKELKVEGLKNFNKIGIMAGASTPKENIQKIIEKIENIC